MKLYKFNYLTLPNVNDTDLYASTKDFKQNLSVVMRAFLL